MKKKYLILGAMAVCVALPVGFVFLGLVNVAASNPEIAPVEWLLSTTMKRSVSVRARKIDAPDLSDEARIREGLSQYASMCVDCHGAPGVKPSGFIKGLNPPAPVLADEVHEWEAAELFWITKHGVKMTGMPAFGHAHSDDDIWAMVAFLQHMPTLSPQDYARELQEAGPHSHGPSDDAHETDAHETGDADSDDGVTHDDHDDSLPEGPEDHEHGEHEATDEDVELDDGHEDRAHSH